MGPSGYFWTCPSKPLSVQFSPEVVNRLGLEAMEAFKAVPRRGLEVGGVLLGRSEIRDGITILYIEGFEAVESEHRSGPNYQLSETDLERLEETFRHHRDIVGIYRTQTRSDHLALQPDDVG